MLQKNLAQNNFVQNHSHHCAYSEQNQSGIVIAVVWVDDFIIGLRSQKFLCAAKYMMNKKFKMTDLGRLSYFLGFDFDQGDGYLKINQETYSE